MTDDQTIEEKLIDKIALKNGLTLKLSDRSKRVAGDRWFVCFSARIEVDVKPEYFEGEHAPDIPFDDIRAAVGDKVTYRYEKTRKFIAETEKVEVFNGLKERFLKATLEYISSADFPSKLILKQYREALGELKQMKFG
ncbi:MAG: hypothetical protein HWN68_08510 [Desulfobacterales bacterium]|nr:hypothetical protein [Desulfobacterales bacterium]